jgi:hypothetical protein
MPWTSIAAKAVFSIRPACSACRIPIRGPDDTIVRVEQAKPMPCVGACGDFPRTVRSGRTVSHGIYGNCDAGPITFATSFGSCGSVPGDIAGEFEAQVPIAAEVCGRLLKQRAPPKNARANPTFSRTPRHTTAAITPSVPARNEHPDRRTRPGAYVRDKALEQKRQSGRRRQSIARRVHV